MRPSPRPSRHRKERDGPRLNFTDRPEAAVCDYKAEHPDWATRKEAEYGGLVSAKEDIADAEAAVRWLGYWGSCGCGFGFSGWY